jgi:hypothetical protein
VQLRGEERAGATFARGIGLLRFAFEIVRWGRRQKPFDIVISDPPPTAASAAMHVARKHRAAYIYYMSDCWSDSIADIDSAIAKMATPFVRHLEGRVWSGSHLVVTVSDRLLTSAQNGGAQRALVMHNGVDLARFPVDGPTWKPESDLPFFVYAGNYGELQGATVFVEAATRLWHDPNVEDFALIFIGYGADEAELKQRERAYPGRVILLGQQPPEMVAAAVRGSIGGLSSLRPILANEDARPLKTMTYAAVGCPNIYVGDGDFAAELSQENLGLVSTYSVEGVESILRKALSWNAETIATLRTHARNYARERWDQDANMKQVAASILEFADSPQAD